MYCIWICFCQHNAKYYPGSMPYSLRYQETACSTWLHCTFLMFMHPGWMFWHFGRRREVFRCALPTSQVAGITEASSNRGWFVYRTLMNIIELFLSKVFDSDHDGGVKSSGSYKETNQGMGVVQANVWVNSIRKDSLKVILLIKSFLEHSGTWSIGLYTGISAGYMI